MKIVLTPLQRSILSRAHTKENGVVRWFPDHIHAGVRAKILKGLKQRGLVTFEGDLVVLTPTAYETLGVEPIIRKSRAAPEPKPSKQDQVIALLNRAQGATIQQLCDATDWQAHTVRAFLSWTLKKRLGLTITSEKSEDTDRVYRLM